MERPKRSRSDYDDDGGGDDEEGNEMGECAYDHEPTSKKPKRQHQQTAPLSASSTSAAQIQVLECDDLVCVIMTV
jgi:hypothetical protein